MSDTEPVPATMTIPVREKGGRLAPTTVKEKAKRQRAARRTGTEVVATVADAKEVIPEGAVATDDDLAATVAKKTLSRLASGELQPNIRDGLMAQQLLDRREEKAADRQFMLTLARALSGGGYTAPMELLPASFDPPEEVVEGYYEEVPLAPEHLRDG